MARLGPPGFFPKNGGEKFNKWVPFLRPFPGNEAHKLFCWGSKMGGFGWGANSLCWKSLCAFSIPYLEHAVWLATGMFATENCGDVRLRLLVLSEQDLGVYLSGVGAKFKHCKKHALIDLQQELDINGQQLEFSEVMSLCMLFTWRTGSIGATQDADLTPKIYFYNHFGHAWLVISGWMLVAWMFAQD